MVRFLFAIFLCSMHFVRQPPNGERWRRLGRVGFKMWKKLKARKMLLKRADSPPSAGRVREWHYCHSLPSERYVRLSSHTAQASQRHSLTGRPAITFQCWLHDPNRGQLNVSVSRRTSKVEPAIFCFPRLKLFLRFPRDETPAGSLLVFTPGKS
jgi:hypothetical protein